ncbi:MAG: lipid-binding SYLF domain-containing protein [Herbaspirillum sp.]
MAIPATALADLYEKNPHARKLGSRATAVLVFPNIVKGGFIVGAEGGNGALINRGGSVSRFYQTAGASYGLQAGVQKFGYALFLMHPDDVKNLDRAGGWDIGSSPSVVVVDKGAATEFTTKRLEKGSYAVFFDQRGLMAGIGLQGTKITRIHPGP